MTTQPRWRRLWASHAAAIALAVIVIVGVVERLYRFTAPILDQHYFRQTQTAAQVWLLGENGFDPFHYRVPMFGGGYWVLEFPWYQSVVYALSTAFGFHEELGRVVSIAAFVASAVLLYEIGRRLLASRGAAICAVFFLAFMPITVFYYRAFLIDPFLIAFALLMLLAAIRLAERFTWTWLGVFLGAMLVTALGKTNLIVVFALPVITLLYRAFIVRRASRSAWATLLGGIAVIGVLVALWTRHSDALNEASNGMTYSSMRDWYFGSTLMDADLWTTIGQRFVDNLGVLGILSVGLGLAALPRLRSGYRIELVGLIVGGIGSIAVFANLNRVHDYYQLPYYPTIALIGGLGVWSLASAIGRGAGGVSRQIAAGILIAAALTWTHFLFVGSYFNAAALGPQGLQYRDRGAEIQAHTPRQPIVVVSDQYTYNDPSLMYEARRNGWHERASDPAATSRRIRTAQDLGAVVFFKGSEGVPPWLTSAARARGLSPSFESDGTIIYTRAP